MKKYTVGILCFCYTMLPAPEEVCIPSVVRNPFQTRTPETSRSLVVTAASLADGTRIEFFISSDGVQRRVIRS